MAVYREGNRGSGVSDLQSQLRNAGYNISVDGIYGPQTAAAVKDFQARNNLTVDAIAGPQTMGALKNNVTTQKEQQAVTADNALAQLNNEKFSYNPNKDKALQSDIAFTNRQIMESMNERGILYSNITGEEAQRSALGLTAQYRQIAYNKFQDRINAKRAQISDAMNRVQTMGYVDNFSSQVLGIPAGTPSYQAKKDADQRNWQLQMLAAEYEFRNKYENANNTDDDIPVPEELIGPRGIQYSYYAQWDK